MSEAASWEQFCDRAAAVLSGALSDEISLDAVVAFFETAVAISNANLRHYIIRAISVIDGNRRYYLELMRLFEARVSEGELVRVTESE
jgi:hypothetical protein